MTDFRALCAELVDDLELCDWPYKLKETIRADIDRARAALAEPEPEGPTLAEVDDLCAEHSFHYEDDESLECLLLIITDALARWGSPGMQSLADGEVAEVATTEMVRQLRTKAATEKANRCHYSATLLTRAANLLEQRHPAPVPVAERLPGDQLCWWFEADEDCGYGSSWTLLRIRGSATCYTHWLPATALPLPGQEVR